MQCRVRSVKLERRQRLIGPGKREGLKDRGGNRRKSFARRGHEARRLERESEKKKDRGKERKTKSLTIIRGRNTMRNSQVLNNLLLIQNPQRTRRSQGNFLIWKEADKNYLLTRDKKVGGT